MTRLVAFLAPLVAALLAAPAAAQLEVTPASRFVVVTAGKSASVSIDAGECTPTWAATSADENVATVTPATANAGSKRSFKIKTGNQGSTTVTITLTGAGLGCEETIDVDITVVVVMDAKAVLKFWLKGDKNTGITGVKGHLKALKAALKAEEKALSDTIKQTLADLEAGAVVVPTEGPGDTRLMADAATSLLEDALGNGFDAIYNDYKEAVQGMSDDGYQALLLYGFGGFLAYAPPGFFEGGCAEWDESTADAWDLFVTTVERLDDLVKKSDASIRKLVPGLRTMAIQFEPGTFTTGGLEPVSNGKFNDDANGGGKLEQKRPKATNYTDDTGNNNHGRIRAKGKADAGTVDVKYEKLRDDGEPVTNPNAQQLFEDNGVTVNADCTWRSTAPGLGAEPNLEPGRWRVTVTQNGMSKVETVTIPM